MRFCRKIGAVFSLLLVVVSIIGTCNVFADFTPSSENENVDILTGLGVINTERSDAYDADQYMNRQEFMGALGRLFDIYNTDNTQIFDDVPASIENFSYINAAYNLGIISGYEDNQFHPYDNILYSHAVKCILYAAGYREYIKLIDDESLVKSLQLSGLGKGLSYNPSQPMKRREMADLLVNALDVPIMPPEYIPSNKINANTTLSKTKTVMTECLKVSKIEGIVNADKSTNIHNSLDSGLSENKIIIDTVECEYTEDTDLLGQYVTAYLKYDDSMGIYKVLYIFSTKKNEVTTLPYNDFSFSGGKIVYSPDGGKEIKYTLSDGAVVIYNGKFIGAVGTKYIDESDFNITSGYAVLIDNDNDRKIDVVKLIEYENVYVSRINMDEKAVYDGNSDQVIKFDDSDREYKFYYNNKETVFEKISNENVLSIVKSRDGELVTVYISDTYITGTVNLTSENKVTIDDDEYVVSAKYLNLANDGRLKKLDVRTCGTFYLNIENEIVAFKSGRTENYGYIVSLYPYDTNEENALVKLYTDDGEFRSYEFADVVSFVNGETSTKIRESEVCSKLSMYDVIKFRLNDDGQINTVENAKLSADYSSKAFNKHVEKSELEFHLDTFGAKYFLDDTTIVLNVPDPDSELDLKDVRNYSTTRNFRGGLRYIVDIYGMDEFRRAKVIVHYRTSQGGEFSTGYSHPLAVEKANMEYIDGEVLYKISGYQQNSKKIIYAEDLNALEDTTVPSAAPWLIGDFKVSDIKFGDIIQYNLNGRNQLAQYRVLFRPSVDVNYSEKWTNSGEITDNYLRAHMYTAFSEIKAINNKEFVYATPGGGEKVSVIENATTISIVDMAEKTVSPAIVQDIMVGDKVFVMITYDRVYAMFIYRY